MTNVISTMEKIIINFKKNRMNKLPKMSVLEYTIPVGQECECPSWVEAYSYITINHFHGKQLSLMIFRNDEEANIMWGCYDKNSSNIEAFPLFPEHKLSKNGLMSGFILHIGQYFAYHDNIYQLCEDKELVQVVRRISVFASTDDARAAYFLSSTGERDKTPQEQPQCSLVRLVDLDTPKETLCISWLVKKDNTLFLQPVFDEDFPIYHSHNINNLNWEYMHEGDTFIHGEKAYQICLDDKDLYYIGLLPFRILKNNSPE